MGKRLKFTLASAAVMLVVVIFWQVTHLREPDYNGKPLSEWFNQLPLTAGSSNQTTRTTGSLSMNGMPWLETSAQSEAAIRVIGKQALPFLLKKLSEPDSTYRPGISKIRLWLAGWTAKLGIHLPAPRLPQIERAQATTGLLLLRPLPEECNSRLRRLIAGSVPEVAASALCVLRASSNLSIVDIHGQLVLTNSKTIGVNGAITISNATMRATMDVSAPVSAGSWIQSK